MRDRALEAEFYPRQPLQPDEMGRVLCLAPHPDDEVIGCGGLLSALIDHGQDVLTIVLTDGQAQSLPEQDRRAESRAAAQVLGTPVPEFWGLVDRTLLCSEPLIQKIRATIEVFQPSHILLPSLSEPHPDHQAVALAALTACMDCEPDLSLLFYEAGAPLVPNRLFDFSERAERKWRALACFSSQEAWQGYLSHAKALAQLRAHGFQGRSAEAFYLTTSAALKAQGPAAAQPLWPVVRNRLGLALHPKDLPVVSVVIRSMDRPSLRQALQSVALQTYPRIEILVVAACGHAHGPLPVEATQARMVWPEERQRLGRSAAANAGLAAAEGELVLFLDDDDLLDPHHLARLVSALNGHRQSPAAYAGVRVVDQQGTLTQVYDLPWSRERLMGINFLPIQAVLFRRAAAVQAGLHFREDLPVLEDWDFWRRLAAQGDFVQVPGVSATYRKLDDGSALSDPSGPNYWQHWHTQLLQEEVKALSSEAATTLLAWHARALDAITHQGAAQERALVRALADERDQHRAQLAEREARMIGLQQQLEALLDQRNALEQGYLNQIRDALKSRDELRQALEQQIAAALSDRDQVRNVLEQQLSQAHQAMGALQSTKSWRWTAPLRALAGLLRGTPPAS